MVANVFMDANSGDIPEWTVFDRHRKAREWARLEQGELSAAAGISRATISATENGHRMPSQMTTRLWALATHVPEYWLLGLDEAPPEPRAGGRAGARRSLYLLDEWAPWGSNPRPADYRGVGWDDNRITFAGELIPIDDAPRYREKVLA